MIHRGIAAGFANTLASARDASVERAYPVKTTVLSDHVTQNLKGLGNLDSKLKKGGILSGLGPPRGASPDPIKKKGAKSARAKDLGKTSLQQRLMTPLKESARSKGKKGKKKKAAPREIVRPADDQDVEASTTQNEETKNAISEHSLEEEATGEDHNLQLPSHDWGGGSGEVQQPAHGAHPSFSPGDA